MYDDTVLDPGYIGREIDGELLLRVIYHDPGNPVPANIRQQSVRVVIIPDLLHISTLLVEIKEPGILTHISIDLRPVPVEETLCREHAQTHAFREILHIYTVYVLGRRRRLREVIAVIGLGRCT